MTYRAPTERLSCSNRDALLEKWNTYDALLREAYDALPYPHPGDYKHGANDEDYRRSVVAVDMAINALHSLRAQSAAVIDAIVKAPTNRTQS